MLTRFGFRVFRFAAEFQGFKSSGRNRAAHLRLRDDGRHIFHARFFGGESHLRFEHAFEFGKRLLQTARVVVIREALDDEVRFACGNAISRALDARDHLVEAEFGGIKIHRGALRREIDDCRVHAIEFS